MREELNPMVEQVFKKISKEYEIGIHKKTVEDIADYLDIFSFESLKEEKLALLYACKMHCEIAKHIMESFGVNKNRYYLYSNIEYIVKRLMLVRGPQPYEFKSIETDDYLESKVSFIENNYLIEMNNGIPNKKVYSINKSSK